MTLNNVTLLSLNKSNLASKKNSPSLDDSHLPMHAFLSINDSFMLTPWLIDFTHLSPPRRETHAAHWPPAASVNVPELHVAEDESGWSAVWVRAMSRFAVEQRLIGLW